MARKEKVPAAEPLNIFLYIDYREYLKVAIAYLKASKRSFSMRKFAKAAGIGSHSYFRMIVNGERNLSTLAMGKFAQALKLNKKEAAYFEALVLYSQAKTESDRDRYFEELNSLRPRAIMQGITPDQYEYLTQSLYVILREMAALPDFREDPEWIARHVRRHVTPTQVRHALGVLERLKLLVRDKSGKLRHSDRTLEAPRDIQAVEMINYHRQILSQTKDALMTVPYQDWEAVSMTVPIPKHLLPRLIEIWQKSYTDMANLINRSERDFDEVYQINLQMFPVTCVREPDKE